MQRWWLNERRDVSIAEVEEALRWMIGKGLIEQRRTGERSIYRLRAGVDVRELERSGAGSSPGAAS